MELGIILDDTEFFIRNSEMKVLAKGNWYLDHILEFEDSEVECFTWQDDGKFYIDLK